MDAITRRSTLAAQSSGALDRIEAIYLKVLRATLLVVATVLLLFALGWAAISLTRVLRSPDSVVEQPSVVAPSELIDTNVQSPKRIADDSAATTELREQRAFYDDFVKRYFALYRSRYQPNLRADDKRLTIGEFDDLTINTAGRLDAIRKGELDFPTDKQDLDTYLSVVTDASASDFTGERLAKYRTARKRPVGTSVQRTRVETRRGWDSYSTSCVAWYESPIGCAVTRRVEIPYTQRVTAMRYPEGTLSPNDVLKGYQDKYFNLLAERRRDSAAQADGERQRILAGQIDGWAGLSRSVLIVGAFFVLMFFFLLVAIERHQRRIAVTLPASG